MMTDAYRASSATVALCALLVAACSTDTGTPVDPTRSASHVPGGGTPGAAGTGSSHVPQYVSVTGGGDTPDPASAYVLTGAAGDGTTDDTAAIQSALDEAASEGKALLIPAPDSFYRISGPLVVATSVIGAPGAYPTIRTVGANGDSWHTMLCMFDYDGPGLVIAGLTLDGGFDGEPGEGEWDHGIEVYNSHNVTIRDNYILNTVGDGVIAGASEDVGPGSSNVLVDGNAIDNTYRHGIFPQSVQDMAVINNRISVVSGYGRIVDFEPNTPSEVIYNVEIAYNVMDQGPPAAEWDGCACSRYAHDGLDASGGHLYLHDNQPGETYGFGNCFWNEGGGAWDDVLVLENNQ